MNMKVSIVVFILMAFCQVQASNDPLDSKAPHTSLINGIVYSILGGTSSSFLSLSPLELESASRGERIFVSVDKVWGGLGLSPALRSVSYCDLNAPIPLRMTSNDAKSNHPHYGSFHLRIYRFAFTPDELQRFKTQIETAIDRNVTQKKLTSDNRNRYDLSLVQIISRLEDIMKQENDI